MATKRSWLSYPDLGRIVFFIFLATLPLVFSTDTLENFEYPKSMWLRACMLCFLVPALVVAGARLTRARPTLAQWLVSWRTGPGRLVTLARQDLMATGVVLFALSAVVSTLTSLNPRISWLGEHTSYFGLTTILAHVAVFFVARALGDSVETMARLSLAGILAALVATAFAFLQLGGVDPVGWESSSDAGMFARPFGTMGHPNHLGALLAMVIPLAWYFATPSRKGAMVAVGIVLLAGMAVTLARAAWLGWAAGMAVLLMPLVHRSWRQIRARHIASFLIVNSLVVLLLTWWNPGGILSGIHDRLANFGSGRTRLLIWSTSLDIIRAHPLFGTGPDSFQLAFTPLRTPAFWRQEWNTSPTRAHNEILQVLANQGAVGALALVVFLLGLAQASSRALRHEHPGTRRLALALTSGVVAFLVLSLFSFTAIGYGPIFVVLAAFLNRLGASPTRGPAIQTATGDSWFRPALFLASALIIVHIAWNLRVGWSARPTAYWLSLTAVAATLTGAICLFRDFWCSTELSRRRVAGESPSWFLALGAAGATAASLLVLVINPWLAHVACARGERLLSANPALALADLEQATTLDPAWDIYWTKLAKGRHLAASAAKDGAVRQDFLRRAQGAWEHLTRINPLCGAHHDNLGQCLALLCQQAACDPEVVFAAFETASTLDPSNPLIYADAADAALRLGRRDKAWTFASAGVERQLPCGPLFGQLGYLYLEHGSLADAIWYLEEALAATWDDHEEWRDAAQANLIVAYHRARSYQKVESAASRFLQDHPEMTQLRGLLADAQEKLGHSRATP